MLDWKALQSLLIISSMLLFMKTLRASMTLRRRNDVRKFDIDAILLREIQLSENRYFNVKATFSVWFRWK